MLLKERTKSVKHLKYYWLRLFSFAILFVLALLVSATITINLIVPEKSTAFRAIFQDAKVLPLNIQNIQSNFVTSSITQSCAYGEGNYGGGNYNEGDCITPTPSPTDTPSPTATTSPTKTAYITKVPQVTDTSTPNITVTDTDIITPTIIDEKKYEINIRFKKDSGELVKNTKVELLPGNIQKDTDSDGYVRFENLSPGDYTVRTTIDGKNYEYKFTVKPNGDSKQNLEFVINTENQKQESPWWNGIYCLICPLLLLIIFIIIFFYKRRKNKENK